MKAFEFLWLQPIHQSIRQLRIVSICAIIWSFDELHELMTWYMLNADLKNGDTAFFAFAAALLAAIWKSVSSIVEQHKKDD